jgi:hypothetical protein
MALTLLTDFKQALLELFALAFWQAKQNIATLPDQGRNR